MGPGPVVVYWFVSKNSTRNEKKEFVEFCSTELMMQTESQLEPPSLLGLVDNSRVFRRIFDLDWRDQGSHKLPKRIETSPPTDPLTV